MSLRINNNIAAINAHRNLTLTTRALSGSMEKLSSGYRINRASDLCCTTSGPIAMSRSVD